MRGRLHLLLISLALMGIAVVLAPDTERSGEETIALPAPAAADTRVARVQGSEAFVAVRYDGRRLRAYACDGSARRPARVSKRFEADWDGRRPIAIVNGGVGLRVERLLPDGRIAGRLDGQRFIATPATGPAGLHERDDRTSIVLADGSVRGTC